VHKRNYDALSRAPIRYILLTQGHVDHVGGVDFPRAAGTQVVAQSNNRYQQADDMRILAFAESVGKGFEYSYREFGSGRRLDEEKDLQYEALSLVKEGCERVA